MQNAYVIEGTLTTQQTIVLDEAVPVANGRVRLVLIEPEATPAAQKLSYMEVMDRIREGQRQRDSQPRTKEEVDAYLQAERDSWGD